jgi:heat shock protein HslJ
MMRYYAIASTLIGTLLILACAANPSNKPATMSEDTLVTPKLFNRVTGREWRLTEMTLDEKAIHLVSDSQTTFACDAGGRVSGNAAINRYSGNLKLQPDGDIIWSKAFIMTRMAGPPELMQQEADFTQALMKTSRMYLNGPGLTLRSQDGSTILAFEPAEK